MTSRHDGRVAVITGGGKGMGKAATLRLLEDGYRVAMFDVDQAALDEVKAVNPDRLLDICGDVRSDQDCRAAIETVVAWGGGLDVLVNCAGVWVFGPVEEMAEEQWDFVLDVNLKGPFLMSRHAVPHLRKCEGVIINIASDAALMGTWGATVYSASKSGLLTFTKSLALELAPFGGRAVAVCPGEVDTPMQAAMLAAADDADKMLEELLAHLPQGERARLIKPEEVAALISYLASDVAAPITGTSISIDFGSTAGGTAESVSLGDIPMVRAKTR